MMMGFAHRHEILWRPQYLSCSISLSLCPACEHGHPFGIGPVRVFPFLVLFLCFFVLQFFFPSLLRDPGSFFPIPEPKISPPIEEQVCRGFIHPRSCHAVELGDQLAEVVSPYLSHHDVFYVLYGFLPKSVTRAILWTAGLLQDTQGGQPI